MTDKIKLSALNNSILGPVYNLATGKTNGLTVGFVPNDPEILRNVTRYRQYTLAFEMVNELAVALESEGMIVNPFVQELLLNMLTMANDQKAWSSMDTRLQFTFSNDVNKVRRKIELEIRFTYEKVKLFECSHTFAIKAIKP